MVYAYTANRAHGGGVKSVGQLQQHLHYLNALYRYLDNLSVNNLSTMNKALSEQVVQDFSEKGALELAGGLPSRGRTRKAFNDEDLRSQYNVIRDAYDGALRPSNSMPPNFLKRWASPRALNSPDIVSLLQTFRTKTIATSKSSERNGRPNQKN